MLRIMLYGSKNRAKGAIKLNNAIKNTSSTKLPDFSQSSFDSENFIAVTTIGTPILLNNWAIPILKATLDCSTVVMN